MRRRTRLMLMILVLLVLAAAAAAAGLAGRIGEPEEEKRNLLTADPETVQEISWQYGENRFSFVRRGEAWFDRENEQMPASPDFIRALLNAVTRIDAFRTLDQVDDLSRYGLTEDACRVTVKGTETVSFRIGSLTAVGDGRYLSFDDGRVYLTAPEILDPFLTPPGDRYRMEEIPAMEGIYEVTLQASDRTLVLQKQPEGAAACSAAYEWFTERGTARQPLDPERMQTFLEEIQSFRWKALVSPDAAPAELEQYGLQSPEASVTVRWGQEQTFCLELGNPSGDFCYARPAGSQSVYKVELALYETLRYTSYHDLKPDEIMLPDWDLVTELELYLPQQSLTVGVAASQENGLTAQGHTETETVDLTRLLNQLASLTAAGYAQGAEPEGAALLRLVFACSNPDFPRMELAFYSYNRDSCLYTLNGVPHLFLPRKAVEALCTGAAALLTEVQGT